MAAGTLLVTLTHTSSPTFGSLSIARQQVGPIPPHRLDLFTASPTHPFTKVLCMLGISSVPLHRTNSCTSLKTQMEQPSLLTKALYGIPRVQPL